MLRGAGREAFFDRELAFVRQWSVEHLVTAVLAKLEARSRVEAVRLAYERRIIPRAQLGISAATFAGNLGVGEF
jgi:hypothetical protein